MQAVAVEGQEQSLVTDYVMKVGEHGFWVGYVNQVRNWPANGIQNPAFRKQNNLNTTPCAVVACAPLHSILD
jgi:hypothetical protein